MVVIPAMKMVGRGSDDDDDDDELPLPAEGGTVIREKWVNNPQYKRELCVGDRLFCLRWLQTGEDWRALACPAEAVSIYSAVANGSQPEGMASDYMRTRRFAVRDVSGRY